MNAVVTLNIDDYLCDNARESMKFACDKWGCIFHEITENYVGEQNLCFNKLMGIKEFCRDCSVSGVMYIDADCLIRSDAPNPFTLFTENKFYAVRDAHDNWTPERIMEFTSEVTNPWLREVHSRLGWDVNIDDMIRSVTSWFFNAGVFLINRVNEFKEIDTFLENIPFEVVNHRIEQAMWNYILKAKEKVEFIPYEWNLIDPDVTEVGMNGYVYHFTGLNWKRLKELLPNYRWKYDDR